MNKKLIVVCGGGFAKEVIWLARDCGFDVIGVLDDLELSHGSELLGVKVLGPITDWPKYPDVQFSAAIGSPRSRKKVVDKMLAIGSPLFATLIHPTVKYSDSVTFGEGAIICAGSIFTVDVDVGSHCIVNLNCTIGHETTIGDFVTVAPIAAISGNVRLEDYVEVGTGACIKQGATLARGSMLGMGGVLTKNIGENMIYAGNPAKLLKELPEV